MKGLTFGDVWLYCAVVRKMLSLKSTDGLPTYKLLASRIAAESKDSPCYQSLCKAQIKDYNLERVVDRLTGHFHKQLIGKDSAGNLKLEPFGKTVYDSFGPYLDALVKLHGAPSDPDLLRIRVAESLACEIVPGTLRRFRERTPHRPSLGIGKMEYGQIGLEISEGRVAFGLGWKVNDFTDSSLIETEVLEASIEVLLVAPFRAFLGPPPPADELLSTVSKDFPLFVLHGEQQLLGLKEALSGVGKEKIVEVINFQAVLTHVRRGDGVGILPHLPWVIDTLVGKEQIIAQKMGSIPPQQIVCYLPRGGVAKLSEPARHLFEALRQNVDSLYRKGGTSGSLGEVRRETKRTRVRNGETLPADTAD
jgi:DNA-binding transcriptional LysR family regulator